MGKGEGEEEAKGGEVLEDDSTIRTCSFASSSASSGDTLNTLAEGEVDSTTELQCAWWDPVSLNWTDSGCTVLSVEPTRVQCQCTHLTEFALLLGRGKSGEVNSSPVLSCPVL